MPASPASDSATRFDALRRAYGDKAFGILSQMHIVVVGMGGVGSWTAETLARSAVGAITLIDPDDVTTTNINRQLHALDNTIGKPKVEVMAERIAAINPACRCTAVDDMLVENNLEKLLPAGVTCVIDAIDTIRFKAALIHHCRRRKLRIVTTGGAGGRIDPLQVTSGDLSRTWNDPLAAKVRSRLRAEFGFSRNPKRRYSVPCVFSTEQARFPTGDGAVTHAKPGVPGASLDCDSGYGSVASVTAVFGLVAASIAMNRSIGGEALATRQRSIVTD